MTNLEATMLKQLEGQHFSAFDLETTGKNPLVDRIVSANITHGSVTDGEMLIAESKNWLLDPGIEIPEETSKIHGITTERVRAEGAEYVSGFTEIALELQSVWATGGSLVVYNAAFDLTLMYHEGKRIAPDVDFLGPIGTIIDPMVIDKSTDKYRKGARDLATTAAHYGVALENAHSADGDAAAALQLALKVLLIPRVGPKYPNEINEAQRVAYYQSAESLRNHWTKQAYELKDEARAAKLADVATINDSWPINLAETA